jgi:hypothetical protein
MLANPLSVTLIFPAPIGEVSATLAAALAAGDQIAYQGKTYVVQSITVTIDDQPVGGAQEAARMIQLA